MTQVTISKESILFIGIHCREEERRKIDLSPTLARAQRMVVTNSLRNGRDAKLLRGRG